MAKSIPTSYSDTLPSDYATGEVIRNDEWQAINDGQAFHFSRSAGFVAIGKSFDPVLSTTSGTFSAPLGLISLQWTSDFYRLTNLSGSSRYRVWMVIIGERIDVRLNVRSPGGSNTSATATKSGAGFGRATAVITGFSAGAPYIFDLEFRRHGGSGTGRLAQVLIREEPIISAAFLPTGR